MKHQPILRCKTCRKYGRHDDEGHHIGCEGNPREWCLQCGQPVKPVPGDFYCRSCIRMFRSLEAK